jgi:hypothetical protein
MVTPDMIKKDQTTIRQAREEREPRRRRWMGEYKHGISTSNNSLTHPSWSIFFPNTLAIHKKSQRASVYTLASREGFKHLAHLGCLLHLEECFLASLL